MPNDFDINALQDLVDLGPYHLSRCSSCRGVNITPDQKRCLWCNRSLRLPSPQRRYSARFSYLSR